MVESNRIRGGVQYMDLSKNKALRHLNLGTLTSAVETNEIDDTGARHIDAMLKKNKTLRTLSLSTPANKR